MNPSEPGLGLRFPHLRLAWGIAALSAVLAMGSPAARAQDDGADDGATAEGTDDAPAVEEAAEEADGAGDGDSEGDGDSGDGDSGDGGSDGSAEGDGGLAAPPPVATTPTTDPGVDDGAQDAGLAAPPPAETAATAEEPTDDTAAEEAAAAAPAPRPEPRVWRNSFFFWSNNVSAYTFLPNTPNAPNTYDPFYEWSFSLQPRWYVGPSLFLRVRQNASIEWTESEFRVRERELVFDDTVIDLLEGNLASIAGVTFSLGGRAILPVSIQSQNNTMLFGAAVIGLARYSFRDVLNGMTLILSTAYTYRQFDKDTPQTEDDDTPISDLTDVYGAPTDQRFNTRYTSGDGRSFDISGPFTNAPHSYGLGISAVVAATNSLFLSGSFSWSRGWSLRPGEVDCGDTSTRDLGCNTPASEAENRADALFFSIGGSYQFNKWLNIGLSMSTPTLLSLPSAHERFPLWNYGTTFSLTTQITLDQLYSDLFERREGGAVPLPGQAF